MQTQELITKLSILKNELVSLNHKYIEENYSTSLQEVMKVSQQCSSIEDLFSKTIENLKNTL